MPRYSFGAFTLDTDKRLLTHEETPVALTPKAFDTLVVLVEARATAVSKDELLARVWPDVIVEESNLAQVVFTLRRALGDDPSRPRCVATVARYGYRFVADVVEHPHLTVPTGRSHDHAIDFRRVGTVGTLLLATTVAAVLVVRAATSMRPPAAGVRLEAPQRITQPNPNAYDFYLRGRAAFGAQRDMDDRAGTERAREWYLKALRLDPNLAEAHAGLAAVEFRRYAFGWNAGAGVLDRARELAERAIALDPTVVESYDHVIAIEWISGRSRAGLEVGRRIERAGLSDVDALLARANAYHLAGLGDKAAALLAGAIALDPANSAAQFKYIVALNLARRYQDAIDEAQRFRLRFGDQARVHNAAGLAHWWSGHLDLAHREFETAMHLAPTDILPGYNLAWLTLGARDAGRPAAVPAWLHRDVATLETRVAAYPDNVANRGQLAKMYGLLGRRTAVEAQERAIARIAGGNGQVMAQVGMAYANLGDFDRATAIWSKSFEAGYSGLADLSARYPALAHAPAFEAFGPVLTARLAELAREF